MDSLLCLLCRYEELLREEEVASQDIAAFEKRLEAWSRSNDRDTAPAPGKGSRPLLVAPTENTPAAVVAFEVRTYICSGHTPSVPLHRWNTAALCMKAHLSPSSYSCTSLQQNVQNSMIQICNYVKHLNSKFVPTLPALAVHAKKRERVLVKGFY